MADSPQTETRERWNRENSSRHSERQSAGSHDAVVRSRRPSSLHRTLVRISQPLDDAEIECMLIRAQEMARYVEHGALDAGLTGFDWVVESGLEVVTVSDLDLCQAEPRQSALGAGRAGGFDLPARGRSWQHASSPPNWSTSREIIFESKGVAVQVEFSWGATEVKPPMLADAIVEVTETGSSLKANRLRIIDTVLESNTQIIANKSAWTDLPKAAQDREPCPDAAWSHGRPRPRGADAERAQRRSCQRCSRFCRP